MKNLLKKVMVIIIFILIVLLSFGGKIIYAKELTKPALSAYDDIINRNYITNFIYVDYREILKEDLTKSEDEIVSDEVIQQSHEDYLEVREKEKEVVQVSRGEVKEEEVTYMTFEATYYTSGCYKCSGITKSGYDVRNTIYYGNYRIIAVDPKIIPLHSLVEVITPYETFKAVALDTGGKINGKIVDILVKTNTEAYEKGRHNVQLRVIEYGGK